jgi:CRISPR-associated endonuclease/helicase Cas3
VTDPIFPELFELATGNPDPFPWQEELFRQFKANTVERSLDIPTGLGKTAVMAIWLLARAKGAAIPRRLVYVVDRRAVVDQATDVANTLREAVQRHPELAAALKLNGRKLPISTLRGQHVDNKQWLEDPSLPAIIVGTIDMVGSRLLFEGYGVSRKMRPYHAGLLGADVLFILDEAHLVPPFEMLLDAIASDSAKVAPRGEDKAIVPPFKLMSLSATGRRRSDQPFTLTEKDFEHPIVRKRLDAKKRLLLKPLKTDEALTTAQLDSLLAESLAREAWQIAELGAKAVRVIAFCHKPKVAKAAKEALEGLAKKADQTDIKERTELFVGGRRVFERERAATRLEELGFIAGVKTPITKPVFVFATSAGEVGVDLDADHMVSDLVEWERMIQRLGRVNRRGEGDARVIIIVPQPTPQQAVLKAFAKAPNERSKTDNSKIAKYEAENERMRAIQRPFELLRRYEDSTIDASPDSILALKQSTEPSLTESADHDSHVRAWRAWILAEATTPEPLRPALTRPIVDAWSMTSLKEHTGRPEIGPWLRGWIEDDPQTTVVWRTHLPIREKGRVSKKEIEAFFEAAPPHTSEALEIETSQVTEWLTARAKALKKALAKGEQNWPPHEKQRIAFVLSPAGDLRRGLTLDGLQFEGDDKRGNQDRKDRIWKALAGGTLFVDARFAGLNEDGLLDSTEKKAPRAADDGQDWLRPIDCEDGEPVIRFRIRAINTQAGESRQKDPQWRFRRSFSTAFSEEDEPSGELIVEKWRSDSTTEEDGAVGRYQLLEDHQKLAEVRAHELAKRLDLPCQYARMLAIAARLHDEGKRAPRWQRAFNAPSDGIYAKTEGPIDFKLLDGFRHEFQSLEDAMRDPEFLRLNELQELALHLIAAHHGFGRPVIGIGGCDAPPSRLESRAREVALRFARLQQDWGPWGLAWWESLLRAVDQQASRENDATRSAEEAAQ